MFVPPPIARTLLDGDDVTVTVEDTGRGPAATNATVTRRRRRVVPVTISGRGTPRLTLHHTAGTGTVDPTSAVTSQLRGAAPGSVAVVALTDDTTRIRARGVVAGPFAADTPAAARAAAATALDATDTDVADDDRALLDLDHRTLDRVTAATSAAVALPGPPPAQAPDTLRRADLRDEPTVTIDGPHTRDLDDAVSARRTRRGNIRVRVHITDVAAHVPADSDLDRHARTLATSVYLAEHTTPMLPTDLSEGELSLLPGKDRDTITVTFTVTRDGDVTGAEVAASRIRSDAQLTYAQVQQHLDADARGDDDVWRTVDAAAEAARRLDSSRGTRDTLDGLFDTPPVRVAVEDGVAVVRRNDDGDDAHRLIERLMVAANEVVASWLAGRCAPALYRVHDGVDADRAELLDTVAPDLEEYSASALRDAISAADDDRAASIVAAAAGAMGRARYDTAPAHHFGIDSQPYTHFTSPLRRYADLVVHRAVRAELGDGQQLSPRWLDALATWVTVRSGAAARAEARERDALWAQVLGAELSHGHARREHATVQRLAPAGLAIRLPSLGVRGFVPAPLACGSRTLEVDDDAVATSDQRFRLGSAVPVELAEVDDTGRLLFTPASLPI